MNELTSDKKIKIKRTKDNLAPLLGLLNDPRVTGAEVPSGAGDEATPLPTADPVFESVPAIPAPVRRELDAVNSAPRRVVTHRVFLTGRTHVGKDHLLNAAEFTIAGFADPIYQLSSFFFGEQPKDMTRMFLQQAGQIGRGTISTAYPLNAERAVFISCVRSLAASGAFEDAGVVWDTFGRNPDIWLDALITRVSAADPETRIGVSNCRFKNEFDRLKTEGFQHYHVMCSPQSFIIRLKKDGLEHSSPALKDVSEQMASNLDASVYRTIAKQRTGPPLRVVWNDDVVRPPSSRILTVAQFKHQVGL